MKVGLIVPGFSSDERDWCIPVLVDVVRELGRRADVHIFALRYPYRRDHYCLHGAKVHTLGGKAVRGPGRAGLLAMAGAAILAEQRRSAFSVLHGLWADEPGAVAVTVARLLRIPAVVSVMGGELIALPDIRYGGQLALSNRALSAIALRGANRVTGGSRQALVLARHAMAPSNRLCITKLPWGIDPILFQPCGPLCDLAGDIRLLHVGSLVAIKDQATLLRAMARLTETVPGVHLHILGDGPLRACLTDTARQLGIAPRVTFHGHVDRPELARFYRAADAVVVSSRYEAQLVVALEAALCGTPLVGTAVGLVADLAPDAALAVPVGDDARLAEALRTALQPERRDELRTAARRVVAREYLAPQTAERLVALYRDLAAG